MAATPEVEGYLAVTTGTITIVLTPYKIEKLLMVKARINKAEESFMVDSGSSGNFIHLMVVQKLWVKT